jgi:hypothetical protein
MRSATGRPLRLVGIEQAVAGEAVADERQLPAEVEGVLKPGVHPVSLGGGADVGGVAGEQHPARPIAARHARVAAEAGRVLDLGELGVRQVASELLGRLGDEIALVGGRPHVRAPALAWHRHQDQRRRVEEHRADVEAPIPTGDAGVEDRPQPLDVAARELDPAPLANDAV